MIAGDVVTIGHPFGDSATEFVVSGIIDSETVTVEQGGDHLAYNVMYLTKVGDGGHYTPFIRLPEDMRITKLAFRNRFTQSEKVAIEIASLDDPAAPMQQRALAAALRTNQADIQAATFIDLNRADTRVGVMSLEQYGLIADGRAEIILDTPPADEERHKE